MMRKIYEAQDGTLHEVVRAWLFTDGEMVETIPSDEEILDMINDWCLEPEVEE